MNRLVLVWFLILAVVPGIAFSFEKGAFVNENFVDSRSIDSESIDSLLLLGQPNMAMKLIEVNEHRAFDEGDNVAFFRAIKQRIEASRLLMPDVMLATQRHIDSLVVLDREGIYNALLRSILADYMVIGDDMGVLAMELYDRAVVDSNGLDSVMLRDYGFLLDSDYGDLINRATVRYFVLLKAIEFYVESVERDEEMGQYLPVLIQTSEDFVKVDVVGLGLPDAVVKLLLLYQELERCGDEEQGAGGYCGYLRNYAFLSRLDFVNGYFGSSMLRDSYIAVLDEAYVLCEDMEARGEILLRKAQQLNMWGCSYERGGMGVEEMGEEGNDFLVRGAEVCEVIIEKYQASGSYESAVELLNSIERKELSFSFDKVISVKSGYSSGEMMMRNVCKADVVVIRSDIESFYDDEDNNIDAKYRDKRWVSRVSVVNDLCWDKREHSVRFKMPKLKSGYYVLGVRSDSVFRGKPFYVSNIGYMVQHVDKQTRLLVVDRDRGFGLSGADVKVFDGKRKLMCSLKSDGDGFVVIPDDVLVDIGSGRVTVLSISYGNDTLLCKEDLFRSYSYKDKEDVVCDIMTDRGVYRGGDSIRYKVIAREGRGNDWRVKPGYITVVELRDTERRVVMSDSVRTNDFGSANGVFYIPKGLRNGSFQLRSANGGEYIRVEDFQLPTFEVKLVPTKDAYVVGDTVRIHGSALSYSGFPISKAKVKYTISLSRLMPCVGRGNAVVKDFMGELVTGIDGFFEIEYVPVNGDRFSMYEVEVFVTDISGETESGEGRFVVGSKREIEPVVDEWKLQELRVEAMNKVCRVGEVARIAVGSCLRDAIVHYTISNSTMSKSGLLRLNNSRDVIEIPIGKEDRGGVTVSCSMMYKNKLYDSGVNIEVPFDNKELVIRSKSIRDKVKPGDKESWVISVEGNEVGGDKEQLSEVVVTMYDASLDVFGGYYWNVNPYRMKYNYMWMLNKSIGMIYGHVLSGSWYYNYAYQIAPRYNFISPRYRRGVYSKMSLSAVSDRVSLEGSENMSMAMGGAGRDERIADASKPFVPRENFENTAFFYPGLVTDDLGNVTLNFTMPDAITRWRLLAFAHSKDFRVGSLSVDIESLRELMIIANVPSFLRSGDKIDFTARATNLTVDEIKAEARLVMTDANGGDTIVDERRAVVIGGGENEAVSWGVMVPEGVSAVRYLLTIESGGHDDGETNVIDVLPSRVMFTEVISVSDAKLQDLSKGREVVVAANPKADEATIEVTRDPIWLVVQALPSIVNDDKGSALKLLDNYSAIAITSKIVNDNPSIKEVSDLWDSAGSKYLGDVIFDEQLTRNILAELTREIAEKQLKSGGWSWFDGMEDNLYISCRILSRIGAMRKLELTTDNSQFDEMVDRGLSFVDREELKLRHISLSDIDIEYIYAKSFFLGDKREGQGGAFSIETYHLIDTIMQMSERGWLGQSIENQAKLALAFHRFGRDKYAHIVIDSFRDRLNGSASTTTLTVAYEAAMEIEGETAFTRNVLQWLIKNKQTADWGSTVSTGEACLAIMGSKQFRANIERKEQGDGFQFLVNDRVVLNTGVEKSEAGTGYVKRKVATGGSAIVIREDISGKVSKRGVLPIINVYYEYPENINEIKVHQNGLAIESELLKVADGGGDLHGVSSSAFSIGDIVTVKITVTINREMSFLGIKSQRACGLEPVDRESGYRYFGTVGAYVNQEDSQTELYIERLQAGRYVIEYQLKAVQCGDFSNGFTEIECEYAPQFKANTSSKEIRIGD